MPYKNPLVRYEILKQKRINDPLYLKEERLRQKKCRFKKTKWIRDFKSSQPCFKCNKKYHSVCMDFHHIDRKSKQFEIGQTKKAKNRIIEEIKKCVILCSNCHRLVEADLIEVKLTKEFIEHWFTQVDNLLTIEDKLKRLYFNGKSLSILQWSKITGLDKETIRIRINAGWTIENILTTKSIKGAISQDRYLELRGNPNENKSKRNRKSKV